MESNEVSRQDEDQLLMTVGRRHKNLQSKWLQLAMTSSEVCFKVIEFINHFDSLGLQVAQWTIKVSPRDWLVWQPKDSFRFGVQKLSPPLWFSYLTDLLKKKENQTIAYFSDERLVSWNYLQSRMLVLKILTQNRLVDETSQKIRQNRDNAYWYQQQSCWLVNKWKR